MKLFSFLPVGSITGIALILSISSGLAGSATWNANPTSGDWRDPKNWTPKTVPNSETDVATFDASTITDVYRARGRGFLRAENDLASMVFTADASPYTIHVGAGDNNNRFNIFVFFGAGIVNNSAQTQSFIVGASTAESARIYFQNEAAVADNVILIAQGSSSIVPDNQYGAFISFGSRPSDAPDAGNATYVNEGGRVSESIYGGFTNLFFFTKVGAATFINQPGGVAGAGAGHTLVSTKGSIGPATFLNNPAAIAEAEGGWTEILLGSCAGTNFIAKGATVAGSQAGQVRAYGGSGYAYFTGTGGVGSGANGGLIDVFNLPNDAQTIVTAEAGTDGGFGGVIKLENNLHPDQAQFQVLGNGTLDLSALQENAITLGSLAGSGTVDNEAAALSIGNNNLSTTFSGVISGSGSVTKVGTGTWTLTGTNSCTGATTIALGTLGGEGIIAGPATVGTGSGAGAFLAPAVGSKKQTTLTLQSTLTLNSDATYTCTFKAKQNTAKSDKVIANGVTINSGAKLNLVGTTQGSLTPGLTLTLLSNTSASAISGTFSNLADGGIVTVNGNNLQASYHGGDGNDLTLTVVR